MVDVAALLKSPSFLLKIVELVFAIICTGLAGGDTLAIEPDRNKLAVIYATLIGFLMINVIVIMAQILETPLNRLLLLIISAIGFVMFLTAGALMCDRYATFPVWKDGRLIASGVLAIFGSFVYAADVAATYFEQVQP